MYGVDGDRGVSQLPPYIRDRCSVSMDSVQMFYAPRRRYSHVGGISPEAFERLLNESP